jgi:FMN phosphatase YigB (HAD superfamily)
MKNRIYTPYLFIALVITTALCSPFIAAKAFIFDLGGVLIDTNKRVSLQHMGMINMAQYCFNGKISPLKLNNQIKNTFFSILDRTAHVYNPDTLDNLHCAYDEHGTMLPYLMRAWLCGTLTCSTIRLMCKNAIAAHPEWFTYAAEKRIIENLICMVFTPEQFVATRKIYAAGITFIKKCKDHGHQVYVLSNWDAESFELLQKKHPHFFSLFDGIIISGNVNALKPDKKIYQTLISRYDLNPQDCWFIDDQQENINTAQELGINGVVHAIKSFDTLEHNIKLAYSKSVIRRENLNNTGINVSNTKNTSSIIIDGENISPIDSTNDNCLPANA